MTTSKKLSIAIVLALGIQLSAGAFSHDNIFKNEQSHMLTFAQDLRYNNSIEAQKAAQWLEQEAMKNSNYHGTIIDIITNYNLTQTSKIALLSELIAQQKRDVIQLARANRKHTAHHIVESICAGICLAGFGVLCALAIIDDIQNPKPWWYYNYPAEPTITITRRTYYPNFSWPPHSQTKTTTTTYY